MHYVREPAHPESLMITPDNSWKEEGMIEKERGPRRCSRQWRGIAMWFCNNTHGCDLGQSLSLLRFSEHHFPPLFHRKLDNIRSLAVLCAWVQFHSLLSDLNRISQTCLNNNGWLLFITRKGGVGNAIKLDSSLNLIIVLIPWSKVFPLKIVSFVEN